MNIQTENIVDENQIWRKRKSLEPGEADAILKRRKSITSITDIERLPGQATSQHLNQQLSLPSFTDAFPENRPTQTTTGTHQDVSFTSSNLEQHQQRPNSTQQKQTETTSNNNNNINIVEVNNKSNKLELPEIKKKYYNPSYTADVYPFKRHSFVNLEASRTSYKHPLRPYLVENSKPEVIVPITTTVLEPPKRRNAITVKEGEQIIHNARRSLDLSSSRSRYSADPKFWEQMLNDFGQKEKKAASS